MALLWRLISLPGFHRPATDLLVCGVEEILCYIFSTLALQVRVPEGCV